MVRTTARNKGGESRNNVMAPGSRLNPAFDLTRVEDYLEVIYDLVQTKGYAGSTDIAERLGVKSPSVTNMVQRLDGMGLIVYERYRGLRLTAKGEEMARFIKQKHMTIIRFLHILGVGEKTRKLDAEGIEHHVHRDTVDRMEHFVDFVGKHRSWFKVFADAENRRLKKGHQESAVASVGSAVKGNKKRTERGLQKTNPPNGSAKQNSSKRSRSETTNSSTSATAKTLTQSP